MSLFDRLKQAAGELADGASRQADIFKLQTQMGQIEGEIERNYTEAGRRARELYRGRELLDAEIEVIVKRIDGLEDQLQELRAEVQSVQSGEAGAASPSQTQATSAPVDHSRPAGQSSGPEPFRPPAPPPPQPQKKPPELVQVLCPNCGHLVSPEAKFCEECGTKLTTGEDSG